MSNKFNIVLATLLLASMPVFAVKSKDLVVKDKSFVASYEFALQSLKANPFIKSEFESQKEYESRINNIKQNQDLSFTEYFDVNMHYDPEEGNLILNDDMSAYGGAWKNDVYTKPLGNTCINRFYDYKGSKASKVEKIEVHTKAKKSLFLSGYTVYLESMLNDQSGFMRLTDSKTNSYRAENVHGTKVTVREISKIYELMVPTSDSVFESIRNKKIPANKEYAKANIKMRLKVSGKISNYSEIEVGCYYSDEATLYLPLETREYTLGAYIDVNEVSFIDSKGKEILVEF